jgi:hypothetical protein
MLLTGCGQDRPSGTAEARIGETSWTVEVATTRSQRFQGLSGRKHLPEDRGMLFVYPQPQQLDFCMRDCEIPIDVVFLDAEGKVVNFHAMRVEHDRAGRVKYSSYVPAQYALELPSGTIQTQRIRIGQQVELIGAPDPATAETGW